jgi:hypothetical protein
MTQRALLGVLTRAMGLYFLVQVVAVMTTFLGDWGPISFWPLVVSQLAASIACLGFGDRIASWIYRTPEAVDRSPLAPSSSDELWRFACYLVGLYAFVRSARALVVSVMRWFEGELPPSDGVPIRILGGELPLYSVVECVVFATLGVVLIVGPGRVSRWFGRLFGGTRTDRAPTSGDAK